MVKMWKGINFCTGTDGDVLREREGIIFYCRVEDKYPRIFHYIVPYSRILLFPSFIK